MSGVSLPVNRTHGRALIVASAATQAQPIAVLQRLGFECAPVAGSSTLHVGPLTLLRERAVERPPQQDDQPR